MYNYTYTHMCCTCIYTCISVTVLMALLMSYTTCVLDSCLHCLSLLLVTNMLTSARPPSDSDASRVASLSRE